MWRCLLAYCVLVPMGLLADGSGKTAKPVIHAQHWIAITGKPLAATAGARIFEQGGNAVDAACAMLGATSTMWDVLSWGGETQALIYNPETGQVIGLNALGVAPTGATPEFFKAKGMNRIPEIGPLAAVTPGTPGGLMVMLAEYGTMSLAQVLEPSMELAKGYPIDAQTADMIEAEKEALRQWPGSRGLFLVHEGQEREGPLVGELFRQPELLATLQKLVDAEAQALRLGATRRDAIMAAYERFYRGDIAHSFVRGSQDLGGLHTLADLANWEVKLEQPVSTSYKGIDVYKLTSWVQGPVMLQMLNMAEQLDLGAMGYNSSRYIHTLYQITSLAMADRDFYYGDPYFPPDEPIAGLLSKAYAKDRVALINPERNDPKIRPGDPYLYQQGSNPYPDLLDKWTNTPDPETGRMPPWQGRALDTRAHDKALVAGTTSIQAVDSSGWVVSVTPSGGWIPAVIAGDTGIGMSQRMQSFVLDRAENPYNVVAPGKRPRATLTPGIALKQGKPYLSFAVQGGDIQDQVLFQFFLAVVEFGLGIQEAVEAPHFWSYQLRNSFGDHRAIPGKLMLRSDTTDAVIRELEQRGYELHFRDETSGPINAVLFDQEQGTLQGGASNFGDDYGIGW